MCSAQVKELLHPYGMLKAFNLVMDKHTGNSKVRGVVCYVSAGMILDGHGCWVFTVSLTHRVGAYARLA